VELTQAGLALLPAARRAVAAAEEGLDAVASVHGLLRGKLTLGVIQTLGLVSVPELLSRFHRRHPAVTLRLHHGSVASLVQRTADGELDLAIVDLPLGPQGGRVNTRALGTEALLLSVPPDDPLAGRRRVRLAELGDRDFVEYRPDSSLRASIEAACKSAGLRRRVLCEADTIPDLVELVAHGLGVALLPPLAVQRAQGSVVGLPTEPSIGRELMVATPRERPPSPAAQAFLDLLDGLGPSRSGPSPAPA
jgi:DNA-binding transcriptional LysR family regulator